MKRTRHTPEQIVTKLREADAMLAAGRTVAQVVQMFGVSEQTYNRWRSQHSRIQQGKRRCPCTRSLRFSPFLPSHFRFHASRRYPRVCPCSYRKGIGSSIGLGGGDSAHVLVGWGW